MTGTKRLETIGERGPEKKGSYQLHLRKARAKRTTKVDLNVSTKAQAVVLTLCGIYVAPRKAARVDRSVAGSDYCDSCATAANLDAMFGTGSQ